MTRPRLRSAISLLLLAGLLGAPPLRAEQAGAMLHDPKTDFTKYQRFAFADDPEEQMAPGATPKGSPFIEKQIQREVRYELLRRGYDQGSLDEADFLIAINVGARTTTWYSVYRTVYQDPYQSYFTQWGAVSAMQLHTFQDGTISIDLIDGESHKLVWHGWATEPIAPRKTTEEIIKSIVKTVLDNFPPGSSQG